MEGRVEARTWRGFSSMSSEKDQAEGGNRRVDAQTGGGTTHFEA